MSSKDSNHGWQNDRSSTPNRLPTPGPSRPARVVWGTILSAIATFAVYSGYIALHEPDPQETVLLGQTRISADGPAGWRILVRDRTSGQPVARARVELGLRDSAATVPLGQFVTGTDGTITNTIHVPNVRSGSYTLMVSARSRLGTDQIERQIEIVNSTRVLLTTDKPIYQPGQTIHLRALVADGRTRPARGQTVTFEVADAKGNKVFKESRVASAFGIASADFALASEVNEGRYHVRVESGIGTQERTVEVKHYVLPKFKATITTDQSYYRPSDVINGSLRAAYFFGKPVANASVALRVSTRHEQPMEIQNITGATDGSGNFAFQFVLPAHFAGLPQLNEKAFLDLTAGVRDPAGQAQEAMLALIVAPGELELAVIPEAGRVVPGITNWFYVVATYPDGRPAVCKLHVNGEVLATDEAGVGVLEAVPAETAFQLDVRAVDASGRTAQVRYSPDANVEPPPLLLRPERAVYQAGETARFSLFAREEETTAFVDVIRDHQTVLTRSVPLRRKRGELAIALPPDLVGALRVNAYVINKTGEDHGHSRHLFVNPASGLRITTQADKPVYRPGETARLEFQVRDSQGGPAPAALGLCVVDESVFALHENQPGLLHQLLESEQQRLKPRSPFLAPPSRWMDGANPTLAQACLAAIVPASTGPQLGDLIAGGLIDPRFVERVRRWRGTPYYDKLRTQPDYREAFQILDGGRGDYSLCEATGPAKKWKADQHRQKYFKQVKSALAVVFWSGIFALPFVLIVVAVFRGRNPWLEILALVAIIFILAGLMLPALAKAKAKAQSVTASSDLRQLDLALRIAGDDAGKAGGSQDGAAPRVRRFFPETLCWKPELITDDQGRATFEIPLADSITTWRASVDAINAAGQLGNARADLRVFQDFFIDLDLPAALNLGDEVSVPAVCHNHLDASQEIRVTLDAGNWFESAAASREQTVALKPREVRSVHFSIKATRAGRHRLLVRAKAATVSDAIERELRVLPVGQHVEQANNTVLNERVIQTLVVPSNAIPGASTLLVKLYPSRFSEIVEGLDSIFEAPHGCFEQTSSTTYPNVLALDYLKTVGSLKPEIEVKARAFISAGYQKLLTFEVPGGGFEWFGRAPANVCLSAYGVLEFTDMARVHPVDEKVIARTVEWLLSQQNPDGSWSSGAALHSWAHDKALVTAYLAWALSEARVQSPKLDRALDYLRAHRNDFDADYTLALAANAFLARDPAGSFGRELAAELDRRGQRATNESRFWNSTGRSITHSRGESLNVETTSLTALALLKSGLRPQSVKEALTWISSRKAPNGAWHTTQASILAMRALIRGSGSALGQDFNSQVAIWLNGRSVDTLHFNRENSDVLRLVSLTDKLTTGANRLELRQEPPGQLPCQISAAFWLPVSEEPHLPNSAPSTADPLEIVANYDRTTLAVNEALRCNVTVRNRTGRTLDMTIVDLGIPAGFAVETAAFVEMQDRGQIAKFDVTGNQVVLYLREPLGPDPWRFTYSLTAKYPLRVSTPASAVYEYYTPTNRAVARPVVLQVRL